MNPTVTTYLIYLPITLAMTVWVARTLHENDRVFLVQAFRGREDMADSVNHLLVAGFYLITSVSSPRRCVTAISRTISRR
jgi:hypothetical protein